MRRLLLAFALLGLCLSAWATDYYVREDDAHGGANNGTSYADAWQGWASINWTTLTTGLPNTLYVCGTHVGAAQLAIGGSGTGESTRLVLDGECSNDPGTLTSSGSSQPVLYTGNRNYITVQNLHIWNPTTDDGGCIFTGNGDYVILQDNEIGPCSKSGLLLQGSTVEDGWIIRRNTIHDFGTSLTAAGRAIYYNFSVASTRLTGWEITDNEIYNGFNAADQDGGGGIRLDTVGAAQTDSGWDGVVISRNNLHDLASGAIQLKCGLISDWWNNTDYCDGPVFEDNTITDVATDLTSSHQGAFSSLGWTNALVSGNSIDGAGVTGAGLQMQDIQNSLIVGNTVKNIISANAIDGNGIYADQRVRNSVYLRNVVIGGCDNAVAAVDQMGSAGFAVFRAWDNTFIGNVVIGCYRGMYFGGGETDGNLFYHNTFIGNGSPWECVAQGFVVITNDDTAITFKNNICVGFDKGVRLTVGNDLVNWDYNLLYDNNTNYEEQTPGSNDVLSDPLFVTGAPAVAQGTHLTSTSPALGTGVYVGHYVDQRSCPFKVPPSIGAYEACSGDQAVTRAPR